MNNLATNLTVLRKLTAETQDSIGLYVGKSKQTVSGWENGVSQPDTDILILLCDFFGIQMDDLVRKDLRNVHLTINEENGKRQVVVHPNVHRQVHPIKKKQEKIDDFTVTIVAEEAAVYAKNSLIPVTDMAAAAGSGIYNDNNVIATDYLQLPTRFVKPGNTCLCVRIKGVSMAPTLQDGGFMIIRLLDKSEWATMPDGRVFVVIDTDGKAYLKRVKNRLKQGFIVLRSDSPDQATYPSFNLEANEIAAIWYAEWYFSAKMPNIHEQFYSKLQDLEDRVDELAGKIPKMNRK